MNDSITYTNTSNDKKYRTKFMSKCYNCAHTEVCRYKDEYSTLLENVEKTFNDQPYNNMFSISVDCKHFKDNNFNMINYKGYDTSPYPINPCGPYDIGSGGDTILDPSKITVTGGDIKDYTVTLKDKDGMCITDTGNKVNLESKDGFHNYYSDKDVFS